MATSWEGSTLEITQDIWTLYVMSYFGVTVLWQFVTLSVLLEFFLHVRSFYNEEKKVQEGRHSFPAHLITWDYSILPNFFPIWSLKPLKQIFKNHIPLDYGVSQTSKLQIEERCREFLTWDFTGPNSYPEIGLIFCKVLTYPRIFASVISASQNIVLKAS